MFDFKTMLEIKREDISFSNPKFVHGDFIKTSFKIYQGHDLERKLKMLYLFFFLVIRKGTVKLIRFFLKVRAS